MKVVMTITIKVIIMNVFCLTDSTVMIMKAVVVIIENSDDDYY